MALDWDQLSRELQLETARSGGAGGQNVNKRNTKVTIRWRLLRSKAASEEIHAKLVDKLQNQITKDGAVLVTSERFRTQELNRADAVEKLYRLIRAALRPQKKRKKAKVSETQKTKRVETKRRQSMKKTLRKGAKEDD